MTRGRLIYSTGPQGSAAKQASACPRCRAAACRCEPRLSLAGPEHAIGVKRERSGRKGKTVTLAGPFFLTRTDASALLKTFKRQCGSGGTLRVGRTSAGQACFHLEIQGDFAEPLTTTLREMGFPARRAGG